MTGTSWPLVSALFPIEYAFLPEGWVHLVVGNDRTLLRGPAGVIGYLSFIPLLWLIPRRWSATYLTISSLAWALLSLGPAYVSWLLAITGGGWVIVGIANAGSHPHVTRRSHLRIAAALLMGVAYALLLLRPQPWPLPPVESILSFYLHWAGIGFVFLRVYHVVIDTSAGRLALPSFRDYAAYLLFAPTLRMGPLYRADMFLEQLRTRPDRFAPADLLPAGTRIASGILRWWIVLLLRDRFDPEVLFGRPEEMPTWELAAGLYAQALSVFLWISGYTEVAIGIGRLMGFRVPDNFNYPWVATGVREFWRRWHITLGAWLRDFIYIPLGGSRRHVFANYVAAFGFCGLWHGLYPSYFVWGLTQAIGLYVDRRWNLFWIRQRERHTHLYEGLRRMHLIESPVSSLAAWLLTFNYQMITIALFSDEQYVFTRILPEFARRFTV